MAKSLPTLDPRPNNGTHMFDVTCVIGSVYIEDDGEESPEVAAFKLIGKHGTEGHFSFPRADGSTCHVIVEHSDPKGN